MKTTADKPTTTASAPETRKGKGSYLAHGRRTIPAKWRTIPAEKPTAIQTEQTKADNEDAAVTWWTPEQRRAKQATETPKKKSGRPYKNPNLVPQGVADHIRDLKAHADKLAEALREAADWLSRSVRTDDQEQAADARAALAAYESEVRP